MLMIYLQKFGHLLERVKRQEVVETMTLSFTLVRRNPVLDWAEIL